MNATRCLMWKEYRVLRGFWISLALFGLVCDGLIFTFVADPRDRLPALFGLVGVMPVLFALGAGATLFALEREEATRDWLRSLPLSSLRVFFGKVLVALGGTLLMSVVMLAVSLAGLWRAFGDTAMARLDEVGGVNGAMLTAAIDAVLVLQALGWAVFFSLRSARPLLAAILGTIGAFAATVAAFFLAAIVRDAALFWGFDRWRMTPPTEAFVVVVPLVIAAIWLVDVRIASKWLLGHRAVVREARTVSRRSPLWRLLWQEWRRSYRLLALLLVIGILFPALSWLSGDPRSVVGTTAIVLALFGACTFLSDQERWQYRFFAEHGVSARTVWLSRETFWGGSALLVAVGWLLLHQLSAPAIGSQVVSRAFPSSWSVVRFLLPWFALDVEHGGRTGFLLAGQMAGFFVWTSLAFGAGQLCSMWFRSGLLAAVSGVMLAGVLILWAALMQILAIGWWWSVAPLAIAMFAATWLRSRGWVLDRGGLRAWLLPALVAIIPVLSLVAIVPVYRVFAIPDAKVKSHTLPPVTVSSEATEAVDRVVKECERLSLTSAISLNEINDEMAGDHGELPEDRNYLVDVVVNALSRLPASANLDSTASRRGATDWQSIAAFVIRHGQVAESHGELRAAWRRYHAALNLARLLRLRSAQSGEIVGDRIERAVVLQLPRWGAQSGQTAEQLTAAIDDLRQLDKQDERLADVIWREYDARMEALDTSLEHPERSDPLSGLIARWAPWEVTRAKRLLGYSAALSLLDAEDADAVFAGRATPSYDVARQAGLRRADMLAQTTLSEQYIRANAEIDERRLTLCFRRATEALLAFELWRIEHGETVPTWSEVESSYLHCALLDPYSGQTLLYFPWGLKVAISTGKHRLVPAGTPLIYSQGPRANLNEYYRIRTLERRSADEPIAQHQEPMVGQGGMGGMASGGMPAGDLSPPAAGGAPAPAQAGATAAVGGAFSGAGAMPGLMPDSPAVQEPQDQYLEGFVFPIPNWHIEDDRASKQ